MRSSDIGEIQGLSFSNLVNLNEKSLVVSNLSSVFDGQEKRTLYLDNECKILEMELSMGGVRIYITPETCTQLAESHKNATSTEDFDKKVRAINPRAYWTGVSPLIETVDRQCQKYKNKLKVVQ